MIGSFDRDVWQETTRISKAWFNEIAKPTLAWSLNFQNLARRPSIPVFDKNHRLKLISMYPGENTW